MGGRTSRCIHVLCRHRYVHDRHESVGGWPEMRLGGLSLCCSWFVVFRFPCLLCCAAAFSHAWEPEIAKHVFPNEAAPSVFTCVCVWNVVRYVCLASTAQICTQSRMCSTPRRVWRATTPTSPLRGPPTSSLRGPRDLPPPWPPWRAPHNHGPRNTCVHVRSHFSIPQAGHTSSKSSSKTFSLRLSQAL